VNTTSHLILNLAILRRPAQPQVTWPVLLGALLPDIAMFVFYGWAKLVARLPEAVIWREAFFSERWQNVFAVGNSVPLAAIGLGIAAALQRPLWAFCFASMLLHHLGDLPLHHDDAHRHFFPLSNFRLISPVSYWDPQHYGTLVALVELVAVLAASAYLLRLVKSRWGRTVLLLANGLAVVFYLTFYVKPLWPA
jgi:hypothetical protein